MKLDPYPTPYIKISSKRIIGLNVKAKIVELLEDIGVNLYDVYWQ